MLSFALKVAVSSHDQGFFLIGLNFDFGMFTLVVKVFADGVSIESRRSLFERIVSVPNSVAVDYDGIRKTLQFLYGTKTIIVFEWRPS